MTVNRKPTGVAISIPAGLAWGGITSVIMTLAGSLITSLLINREVLAWENCGYAVLAILILSSWSGASMAYRRIKRQRTMICLASGGIYFMLLAVTAMLFFGGQFSGVGETGLVIFCGSMMGILDGMKGKSRRKPIKRRLYNC